MNPIDTEYERFLHQRIDEIRLRHERELKPILDALARMHSLRPPAPILVDADVAAAIGAHKEGA